jgi:WD40 repeat protein
MDRIQQDSPFYLEEPAMPHALSDLSRRSFLQLAAAAGCTSVMAQEDNNQSTKSNDELPKGLRRLDVGYPVESLAISPDRKLLATCGRGEMHTTIQVLRDPKKRPRFPDKPGMIVLWDLETLKPMHVLDGSKDCLCVAFSPDGKSIAGGRKHRGARVWDVKTGLDTNTLYDVADPSGDNNVDSLQFSGNSKRLVYGGLQRARVVELGTEELIRIEDLRGRVNKVALKPNSSILALAGQDDGILLFDIGARRYVSEVEFEIKTELKGTAKWVWRIAYSPNGQYLACLDKNSAFWLFDSTQYKAEQVWQFELCRSFAFSPDSKFIALGGPKVRIFELDTRNLVIELPGNMNSQQDLVFSPDGQMLATTAPNLLVNLWDMRAVQPAKNRD